MIVRDQQAQQGDTDCDRRKQNPSSTLPELYHAELLFTSSITAHEIIFASRALQS
jgi:hypothetical protein